MNEQVDAGTVLPSIMRKWWLILLLVALGAAGGYAVSHRMDPTYEAKTTLLVGDPTVPLSVSKDAIESSQLLASAYANLIRSQPILESVVNELYLQGTSWLELRDRVRTDVGPHGSQMISITVYASSPQEAKRIAAAVADRAVALSPSGGAGSPAERIGDFTSRQIAALQDSITDAEEQVAILQRQLESEKQPWMVEQLRSRIDEQQAFIIGWQNNYSSLVNFLAAERSPNTVQVLEDARVTYDPVRPNTPMNIGFGGGIGLIIAIGIAYALAFRTPREQATPSKEIADPVIAGSDHLSVNRPAAGPAGSPEVSSVARGT